MEPLPPHMPQTPSDGPASPHLYIRTFEQDASAVKSGGTPGFTLLDARAPETVPEPAQPEPAPESEPTPEPVPQPPEPAAPAESVPAPESSSEPGPESQAGAASAPRQVTTFFPPTPPPGALSVGQAPSLRWMPQREEPPAPPAPEPVPPPPEPAPEPPSTPEPQPPQPEPVPEQAPPPPPEPVAPLESVPAPAQPTPQPGRSLPPDTLEFAFDAGGAPPDLSPIETYSQALEDKMRVTGATTATLLAAEQDAAPVPAPEPPAPPAPSIWDRLLPFVAGALLFIVAGAAIGYVLGLQKFSYNASVANAPVLPITVDERTDVSGTGAALAASIEQAVQSPIPGDSIELLSPPSATTTVFEALNLRAPDVLLRNIHAQKSMAGVVSVNGEQSPFFLLSVDSYSATFSGMLLWEPGMPAAFKTLFPSSPASPTATTTFSDEVVANHDTRIYRDADGKTALLYGYWDQSTLIIARDEAAFTAVVGRLAATKTGT